MSNISTNYPTTNKILLVKPSTNAYSAQSLTISEAEIDRELSRLAYLQDPNERIGILKFFVDILTCSTGISDEREKICTKFKIFFEQGLELQKIASNTDKIDFHTTKDYLFGFAKSKIELVYLNYLFLHSYIRFSNNLKGKENLRHFDPDELIINRVGDCDDLAIFSHELFESAKIESEIIFIYWDKTYLNTSQNGHIYCTFKLDYEWGYTDQVSLKIKGNKTYQETLNNWNLLYIYGARKVIASHWLTTDRNEDYYADDNNPDLYFYGKILTIDRNK